MYLLSNVGSVDYSQAARATVGTQNVSLVKQCRFQVNPYNYTDTFCVLPHDK